MNAVTFQEIIQGTMVEQVIRDQDFTMLTRHFHESYEFYFLLEGERYYFIDSETYYVKTGMIVLVGKNQVHKTSVAGDQSYHNRILLQLDEREWDWYLKKSSLPSLEELVRLCEHVLVCQDEDFRRILMLLEEIKQEFRLKRECFAAAVRMKIIEILIVMYRNRRQVQDFSQERQGSGRMTSCFRADTVQHKKVHEVAEYLQKCCETKESIEEIGHRFYVSKSYLSRIFKEVTGFTLNEYQTLARIRRTQELLSETGLSVTEIADLAGFESITYFERVFKKYTGKRPLQYRKECRILGRG